MRTRWTLTARCPRPDDGGQLVQEAGWAAEACALTRALTSGPGRPRRSESVRNSRRLPPPARPVGWSAVRDRQVEPAEPCEVAEDVDLGDLALPDREAHHRERPPLGGHDHTRRSVHQRRLRYAGEAASGERRPRVSVVTYRRPRAIRYQLPLAFWAAAARSALMAGRVPWLAAA